MQQVAIGVSVTGVLEDVSVKRGSVVRKGQVLARLSSRVETTSLALAKYKAEQQAALNLAQHKMAFAEQKYARRQTMAAEQLMPEQDKNDAEAEFRLAQAEYQLAQENRQLARYEYQQQQAQLDLRTVRSPLNGVVVEQNAHVGEVVEANSNAKAIVKLAQLDPLRVQVILPQRDWGQFKVGQQVEVTPELPLTGRYTAKIKTIDKVLDAASGSFVVFLELPNPHLNIPAGMRCQARF